MSPVLYISKHGPHLAEIGQHRIDDADLYFQYTRSEGWSLEEGIVKSGSFGIDQGVGVRAVAGEKTAFAYSDDISEAALLDAAATVRTIAAAGQSRRIKIDTPTKIAPSRILYAPMDPIATLDSTQKVALLEKVEKLAREAPRALADVRDNWLPQIERQMRDAMGQPQRTPEPVPAPAPVAPADPNAVVVETGTPVVAPVETTIPQTDEAITVRVAPGGGYDIHLPAEGLVVTPNGEGYIVSTAQHEQSDGDVAAAFVEAVRGVTRNTQDTAATLLVTAQVIVRKVVKGVFTFFIMLMISAYMLVTKDEIIGFFRNFARPERRRVFDSLLRRIDRGLSGVVRGQLLICLINGCFTFVGITIFGIKYGLILSVVAATMSLIPIFGSILSSIPNSRASQRAARRV